MPRAIARNIHFVYFLLFIINCAIILTNEDTNMIVSILIVFAAM